MKKGIKVLLLCAIICATLLCGITIGSHNFFISATNYNDEAVKEFINEVKSLEYVNTENLQSVVLGKRQINNKDTLKNIDKAQIIGSGERQIVCVDGEYREYSRFAFKRLIVNGEVKNTYGALKNITGFLDYNILCYESEEATEFAYNELKKDESLIVSIDSIVTPQSYADNEYSYFDYDSWGAEAIELGGYLDYLEDVSANEEVVVVVIDSGINTAHEKFQGRFITDNGKIVGSSYYTSQYLYSGYTFEDDRGHGTHVSGIICDLTPQNVKILPIKVFPKVGDASEVYILAALAEVSAIYSKKYNIACVNMSLGGQTLSNSLASFSTAIDLLYNQNILTVAAAGNDSIDVALFTPSAVGKAITVSALKRDVASGKMVFDDGYSNFGEYIDISAPGTGIRSAWINDSDVANSSIYINNNGTSMATPHVAGVLALLYLDPRNKGCTVHEIEELLYDYTIDNGEPGWDQYYGNGMLNLKLFEGKVYDKEITILKNGVEVEPSDKFINYSEGFNISLSCVDSTYKLYYSTDGSLPSLGDNLYTEELYSEDLTINGTLFLTVIGYKHSGGEIKERTKPYVLKYFNNTTPVENCFDINVTGHISAYHGHYDGYITIPEQINGITVVSLASNLFYEIELTGLTLPTTCVRSNGILFTNCPNIKYFYAPGFKSSMNSIFKNCPSLTLVSDNEDDIEVGVNGAYLPEISSCQKTFIDCIGLEEVYLTNITNLGQASFSGCINLKICEIPSVTSLSSNLFFGCSSLEKFHVGVDVSSISNTAFYGCVSLEEFTVDGENQYITTDGKALFCGNSLMTFALGCVDISYSIPTNILIGGVRKTITTVSDYAFALCDLNQLDIPSNVMFMNDFACAYATIDRLEYKSKNCSSIGFVQLINQTYHISPIFFHSYIDTINIDSAVEKVPMYMFYESCFDTLIINSYLTTLEERSFFANTSYMGEIVFNFNENIDNTYLTMLSSSNNKIKSVKYISLKNMTALFGATPWTFTYLNTSGGYYIYKNNSQIYTITASVVGKGTISNSGQTTFFRGDSVEYSFVPDDGYCVKAIVVDGNTLSGSYFQYYKDRGYYAFSSIANNHTINVEFQKAEFDVTFNDNYTSTKEVVTFSVNKPIEFVEFERDGYNFSGWYLDEACTTKLRRVTMPEKHLSLYAKWTSGETYFITSTFTGSGFIDPNGQLELEKGANKIIKFYPTAGWAVKSILIDGVALEGDELLNAITNGYEFNDVESDHTINVEFEEALYKLTLNFGCAELENVEYYLKFRDPVVLEDPVRELYDFKGWYVNDTLTLAYTGTVMPSKDLTLYAKWELKKYTIITFAGANGHITPSGSISAYYNEQKTFRIIPDEGYAVDRILINGVALIGTSFNNAVLNGYRVKEILGEHTIEAYFRKARYSILFVVNNGGKNINVNVAYEEKINLPFEPQLIGHSFDGWYTDEAFTEKFELEIMPARNMILYAKYKINQHLIVASAEGNGSIAPFGEVLTDYGQDKRFIFTANPGYVVSEIEIDGVLLNKDQMKDAIANGYELTNVRDHHTINVKFSEKYHKIFLTVDGEGTFVCDEDILNIEYGDDRIFYISGNFNKYNVEIYVNNNLMEMEQNKTILIEDIKEDTIILVKFVYNEDYDKIMLTYMSVACGGVGLGLLYAIITIIRRIRRRNYFF